MDARVNRRPHARWEYTVTAPAIYSHRIPISAAELVDSRCQIMLLVDGASSPKSSGLSDDARELGLSLVSVSVEPA